MTKKKEKIIIIVNELGCEITQNNQQVLLTKEQALTLMEAIKVKYKP